MQENPGSEWGPKFRSQLRHFEPHEPTICLCPTPIRFTLGALINYCDSDE